MQQDKNIQNKLQQLEDQQQPDLSHMDEHWQQMQSMMTAPPGIGSGNGKLVNMNRWIWITSAIVLIAAIIFLVKKQQGNSEKMQTMTASSNTATQPVLDTATSSSNTVTAINSPEINKQADLNNLVKTDYINDQGNGDAADFIDSSNQKVIFNFKDSSLTAAHPDRQQLLNDLLKQLAKNAQEFVIDNSRDTLLTGAEGSTLLIPANSLGGNNAVTISLREFYKTSDIILNKLSTSSNGQQLITGGMVHITASVNGQQVNVQPGKQIRIYMTDTSAEMKQMQEFDGEEVDNPDQVQKDKEIIQNNFSNDKLLKDKRNINTKRSYINWIPRSQYFQQQQLIRKVKVFNVADIPYKIFRTEKGEIAYFKKSDSCKLTRKELSQILKNKYGYYKVRIRNSWNAGFYHLPSFLNKSAQYDSYFEGGVGDTTWMQPEKARKYNLTVLDSQCITKTWNLSSRSDIDNMLSYGPKVNGRKADANKQQVFDKLESKYYIDINKLGWINCDHFSNRSNLVEYAVNLNDSSSNYYTILVFTKIKSMMSGYLAGNDVVFSNVPAGEKVKVISIGINKNGNMVMAVKEATISDNILSDLPFEEVNPDKIKSSLSLADK